MLLWVSARPGFAPLVTASLVALLAIVSNAKDESLREPFVFTDLRLFSQLFRHPPLYLPFLSAGKVVSIAAGATLFVAVFIFGPKLPRLADAWRALVALTSLAAVMRLSSRLDLSLRPESDQRRYGFFATFVAYLTNGLRPATVRQLHAALVNGPFTSAAAPVTCPEVIVIQSESFFDARRLGSSIEPSLLKHFDAARRESEQYGELDRTGMGANTMHTEFAVLTGLPATTSSPNDYHHSLRSPLLSSGPADCQQALLGRAAMRDKDVLIYIVSQMTTALNTERLPDAKSRKVRFVVSDYLLSINKPTGAAEYRWLEAALDRLKGTVIKTNICTASQRVKDGFSMIDTYTIVEKSPSDERMIAVEITLSEWLFNAVQAHEVLTISPDYFRLRKPLERRLYELALKHTGDKALFAIGLALLQTKVGSNGSLREFRRSVRQIAEADTLPDYCMTLNEKDQVVFYTRSTNRLVAGIRRQAEG